jgi:hypothetical protein
MQATVMTQRVWMLPRQANWPSSARLVRTRVEICLKDGSLQALYRAFNFSIDDFMFTLV